MALASLALLAALPRRQAPYRAAAPVFADEGFRCDWSVASTVSPDGEDRCGGREPQTDSPTERSRHGLSYERAIPTCWLGGKQE